MQKTISLEIIVEIKTLKATSAFAKTNKKFSVFKTLKNGR